ncbi:MAG: hypothetical protein PHO00_00105 [bacterium]|nr:hypothetical protein [bacterium]
MCERKKYIVVEEYNPDFDYSAGNVLSLSPCASYQLDNTGIKYSVLSDYLGEEEIRKDEKEIFDKEMAWCRSFDEYLQSRLTVFREKNILPVYFHFSRFKYLIDSLVMQTRRVKSFLRICAPTEVLYIGDTPVSAGSYSIFNIRKASREMFIKLFETVCRECDVKFSFVPSNKAAETNETLPGVRAQKSKSILKYFFGREARNIFKYILPVMFVAGGKPLRGKKILSLDAGTLSIDGAIRKLIKGGADVYVKNRSEIYKIGLFPEKKCFAARESLKYPELETMLKEAASFSGEGRKLIGFISGLCGVNADELTSPFLSWFVEKDCRAFFYEYSALEEFYAENGIDAVISRSSSGINYPAALNASMNSKKVKRVCFQHSCGPLDWRDLYQGDIGYFDYFFSTDSVSEEIYKYASKKYGYESCRILQAPHYLRGLSKKHNWKKRAEEKPLVIFVPKKQDLRFQKYNAGSVLLTWYYDFLKKIVDYMSKRDDFCFVFKYPVSSGWYYDSIIKYISNMKPANIKLSSGKLYQYFGRAERLIQDNASTPMFEACAAGLSVLAMYRKPLSPSAIAEKEFSGILKPYTDARDAISNIEEFLNTPRERYMRKLNFQEDELSLIFQGV